MAISVCYDYVDFYSLVGDEVGVVQSDACALGEIVKRFSSSNRLPRLLGIVPSPQRQGNWENLMYRGSLRMQVIRLSPQSPSITIL